MKAGSRRSVARHLAWGVRQGLLLAALLGVAALGCLVVAALVGPLRASDLPAGAGLAIGLYLAAGIMGGAVVGALRPQTRSRRGAVAVGTVALIPPVLGSGLLIVRLGGGWPESRVYPYYFGVAAVFLSWLFSLAFVRGLRAADEPAPEAAGSRPVV